MENKKKKINKVFKIVLWIILLLIILAFWTKAGFIPNITDSEFLCPWEEKNEIIKSDFRSRWGFDKPVIYLYPQQKQKVKVELNYKWKIIADYPEYDEEIKGWEVEAYPDSRVIDLRDGKEYSYLFWEWKPSKKIDWNLDTGFIVKWKDAREFLREKLEYLGLTPKEYNEFIVYWYPKMMNNEYNLIHFATKKYTDSAPLKITPKPDSMLRVFMIMKSVEKNTKIKPQILDKFERKGFSVIEWGGTELK